MENLKASLKAFVEWYEKHITGDEKGQAQIFLDRLFQAFGHEGLLDAGATTEFRIRKSADNGGGTAFADLVWKPVVLIEMKRRGTDLARYYRQAFDYWIRLVPDRPRYVVLCNFDEFRIYDFETQMDAPVDTIATEEIPNRWGPLAFLKGVKPVFENDRVAVTRQAADALAICFKLLTDTERKPHVDRPSAQRFILQILVALFAEDIDLLPQYFLTTILNDCTSPTDAYDLIGGLFDAMNRRQQATGGRFKDVRYFNGGLFAFPARLELNESELKQLRYAATFDWSKVQPEIFGTLFQHSLETGERHAFGAHFTHPADIMMIVGPTIVEPWRNLVENAKTLTQLNVLSERLHRFRVLDPACGSGNFLYIAYRELKRIEARIFERMEQDFKSEAKQSKQMRLSFLSAQNFYGIDILPFAVEIAKVTMMVARKLAIDELHITEPALPLDNLDDNFVVADALITSEGTLTKWPQADVIIGNPPFLGAKRLKPERGSAYVNQVRRLFPNVPGMADYCVYWIRRAHDHLPFCTRADPVAGRAGLVGTQNIRNNKSRVGGLDSVVKDGTIIEAVDNKPWSGEADVHVSIANWVKTQDRELLPPKCRLWFQVEKPTVRGRLPKIRASEERRVAQMSFRETDHINSALSDDQDVSSKVPLRCNINPKCCFQGKIPGYEGFLVNSEVADHLRRDSAPVIVPYLTGRELLAEFRIERWAIDFRDFDMIKARGYPSAFEYCRLNVLPEIEKSLAEAKKTESDMAEARQEHLDRWWQFWNRRDELNSKLSTLRRYIGCSRVTRRPVIAFLSTAICPSDLVQVFAFDDDYSFGVLQSAIHFEWFRKSSRLKIETDLRYSVRDVFETFPWPQNASTSQVRAVAAAALNVRNARNSISANSIGGLRALYKFLELPGKNQLKDAHEELDTAVSAAYGFKRDDDVLEKLLGLNRDVSREIEKGRNVISPGIPNTFDEPASIRSEDCLNP